MMVIVQVHCADVSRGGLLPDTRCQHLTRPDSEAFCDAGPCISDTWLIGQWGMVRWQMFLTRMVNFSVSVQRHVRPGQGPPEGDVFGHVR